MVATRSRTRCCFCAVFIPLLLVSFLGAPKAALPVPGDPGLLTLLYFRRRHEQRRRWRKRVRRWQSGLSVHGLRLRSMHRTERQRRRLVRYAVRHRSAAVDGRDMGAGRCVRMRFHHGQAPGRRLHRTLRGGHQHHLFGKRPLQLLQLGGRRAAADQHRCANAFALGRWYLLTFTFDGANYRAYVDGQIVGTQAGLPIPNGTAHNLGSAIDR